MAFIKNLQAKFLFHIGLAASRKGNTELAVKFMEESSYFLIEMIQSGEKKYESHYARTKMNLGVLYYQLGMVDESLHSFLIAIRKFTILVMKGRIDLNKDLPKAQSTFFTLYPRAVMDIERGIISGNIRR